MPEEIKLEKLNTFNPASVPISISLTDAASIRTKFTKLGIFSSFLDFANYSILSEVQKIVFSSH